MPLRLSFGLILFGSGLVYAQLLTPPWTELGENGRVLARVIVSTETCPAITVDGTNQAMTLRAPVPARFRPLCEFEIPSTARAASIEGRALRLPRPDPTSVVVIGDTGCRIAGARVQDCNDLSKWPLQAVAGSAADVKPDLIIDVGDYLYRESACPPDSQNKCAGTPNGDNWETWNADFFAPAAKLLAAAPWAFSRGNHENCKRSWQGWFYYLDPRPWKNECSVYTPPYVIKLGSRELVMLDSSAVVEDELDPEQVAEYVAELRSLHVEHAWLVDHHPFWGVKPGAKGDGVKPLSAPLEAAWQKAAPQGVDMVLSGHTHLFAVIPFGPERPMQIVAGDGGTALSGPLPETIDGTLIQGNAAQGSHIRVDFGYVWLQRQGDDWDLSLQATQNATIVHCLLRNGHSLCRDPGQ